MAPSIHQFELAAHRQDPWRTRLLPMPHELQAARSKNLEHVVYGYLPYWENDLTTIRWTALSHLAWFCIEIDQTGEIISANGWPDTATVETAHNAGTLVHLTFALFDGDGILALCSDPQARANAVGHMVDQMELGLADGISVDFEGLVTGTRDLFTQFIVELRAELTRRGHLDAQISVAGPAVDFNDQFDLNQLLQVADWYFVMGYGFFWSDSENAGPTGMMRVTPDWNQIQRYSQARSIAWYSKQIPAERRIQIIWGVPYYGIEWTTISDQKGASTTGYVRSVSYTATQEDLAAGQVRLWDDGIKNPWYVWQTDLQWHQVYYDDSESLAAKFDLSLNQDLAGVGIWALNYDAPYQELWDLVEQRMSSIGNPPLGHRLNPLPIQVFPYHDDQDTSLGPSNYFNYYACAPDQPAYGREWVYRLDLCQSGSLEAQMTSGSGAQHHLRLLTQPDQDASLVCAEQAMSTHLDPGVYLLVADTAVLLSVEQEGSFALDVDFVPDSESLPCPSDQQCQNGQCQCTLDGQSMCDGICTDMQNDWANCGSCGFSCQQLQSCSNGQCQDPDPEDGGQFGDADDPTEPPDAGSFEDDFSDGSTQDQMEEQESGPNHDSYFESEQADGMVAADEPDLSDASVSEDGGVEDINPSEETPSEANSEDDGIDDTDHSGDEASTAESELEPQDQPEDDAAANDNIKGATGGCGCAFGPSDFDGWLWLVLFSFGALTLSSRRLKIRHIRPESRLEGKS